jgi:hypothetical protein
MAGGGQFPTRSQSMTQGAPIMAPVVLLGRLFFALIFLMARPRPFFQPDDCLRRIAGCAAGFHRGAVFGRDRASRWTLDSARIPHPDRRVAHRPVPDRSHSHDVQLLESARPHDARDAKNHVHEESGHAGRSLAHLAVRTWTMESGQSQEMIV